ncbi:YbaB/EbfC family nucleoid-associated protein [Saccharothrix sp. S26]|uniref:YbaB/EbfC family nucleoid-associated protein n=1 Tax=Saccharothrix sp. S26 TaxID=2907215 RepID=UPI001F2B7BEB|nr:YbaB/EbfC family nucleoid-associated protein [Saccharothrix sp. S26]MCE6997998.1 YbaB/EbfC family nucleoid-associated protein [Saccharothrix sp. S26]
MGHIEARRRTVELVEGVNQALAAMEATASSDDGLVDVTVGPGGELRALRLDPRLYRRPDAAALARAITRAARAAAEDARQAAFDMLAPLLPADATAADTDLAFDPLLHHLDRAGGAR